MTVNEALAQIRIVRERLNELKGLRQNVSVRTRRYMSSQETIEEPTYSVKKVDKKIAELENFLFQADVAIKQSNAITQVSLPGSWTIDSLLAPLE